MQNKTDLSGRSLLHTLNTMMIKPNKKTGIIKPPIVSNAVVVSHDLSVAAE